MPNTEQPLDTQQRVSWVRETALSIGLADVYPVGCITKERKGKELTEFGHLKEAGAIALSDDGSPVEDSLLLRRAMEFASAYDLLIISHCEDISLAAGGIIREGKTSSILGLQGIPSIAESIIVAREIELARYLNTRIHLAHISCKRSIDLIRRAKRDGVKVTSETCPHYFSLTVEAWEERYNALLKVNPPLPEKEDIAAIKKALDEGTIDVIASDHAPHTKEEKNADLSEAPFGMIGLELLFPLSYTYLVDKGKFSLRELVKLLCSHPAQILGFSDRGSIKEGKRADLTVIDTQTPYVVQESEIASLSKNTPFLGSELKGKVLATIFGGKIVYNSFK
jgi:dihydroorotase